MMMVPGYAAAAAVAMSLLASAANAQPYYGYGQLPPAPYVEQGGYQGGGGGCGGGEGFTLLGARAGVTVLGFDLGADTHFNAPSFNACGGGGGGYAQPSYAPAPPAPPPEPMGYAPPPSYGYESYAPPPMAPPPQTAWGYAQPCGCEDRGW